jgi:hypothetical protein
MRSSLLEVQPRASDIATLAPRRGVYGRRMGWRFVVGLVVGAIVGGVVVYHQVDSNEPHPAPPQRAQAFALDTEPHAGDLAKRFGPRLHFDSLEHWRPISLSGLLSERDAEGQRAHRFCERLPDTPKPQCERVGDAADFLADAATASSLGTVTYLDIAGTNLSDYQAPERSAACRKAKLWDCGDSPESVIYYRVTQSNRRFYFDYWRFLRVNHFRGFSATCQGCFDEGVRRARGRLGGRDGRDGSRGCVSPRLRRLRRPHWRLPLPGRQSQGSRAPRRGHRRWQPCGLPDRLSERVLAADRPRLLKTPETHVDGSMPWERNDEDCEPNAPHACLRALPAPESDPATWTAWPGLWGATCGERCSHKNDPQSPSSPGMQSRFQAPWCSSQDGVVTCDGVAQGCSDWLGPLVVAVACDPHRLGSALRKNEKLAPTQLKLTVSGSRQISATTPGIVQALNPQPLAPDDQVTVSGAGPDTQLLVRAQQGQELLEARFDPFGPTSHNTTVTIEIRPGRRQPIIRATVTGRGP